MAKAISKAIEFKDLKIRRRGERGRGGVDPPFPFLTGKSLSNSINYNKIYNALEVLKGS